MLEKSFSINFKKIFLVVLLTMCTLTACSTSNDADGNASKSVALVTDGNVNDQSFNQSAWRGLEDYGKEYKLTRGKDGYQYFQVKNQTNLKNGINKALRQKYQTIFAIGNKSKKAILSAAKSNPQKNFVIIDDTIKGYKNIASVQFKKSEGAYLAGVAAANTTKTGKVGFIGGANNAVINSFKYGFNQGVKDQAKKCIKKLPSIIKILVILQTPARLKVLLPICMAKKQISFSMQPAMLVMVFFKKQSLLTKLALLKNAFG